MASSLWHEGASLDLGIGRIAFDYCFWLLSRRPPYARGRRLSKTQKTQCTKCTKKTQKTQCTRCTKGGRWKIGDGRWEAGLGPIGVLVESPRDLHQI